MTPPAHWYPPAEDIDASVAQHGPVKVFLIHEPEETIQVEKRLYLANLTSISFSCGLVLDRQAMRWAIAADSEDMTLSITCNLGPLWIALDTSGAEYNNQGILIERAGWLNRLFSFKVS